MTDKSQDKTVGKLYEGREDLLDKGTSRIGPMTIIKIQKILRRDRKAFAYYIREIGKGRTADMISVDELRAAGAKEKTIESLSGLCR